MKKYCMHKKECYRILDKKQEKKKKRELLCEKPVKFWVQCRFSAEDKHISQFLLLGG